MKIAKITANINNANPINNWVNGFTLTTKDGIKKMFAHRHEAQAYAKSHGYKII